MHHEPLSQACIVQWPQMRKWFLLCAFAGHVLVPREPPDPYGSNPRLPPPTNTIMPGDSWSCILQKSQTSLEALTTIAHRRPTDAWAEHEHARLDTWSARLRVSDSQPTSTQIGFQLDAIATEATLQVLDALIINLVLLSNTNTGDWSQLTEKLTASLEHANPDDRLLHAYRSLENHKFGATNTDSAAHFQGSIHANIDTLLQLSDRARRNTIRTKDCKPQRPVNHLDTGSSAGEMLGEYSRQADKQDCKIPSEEFDTEDDDVELPPELSGYDHRELLRQRSAISAAVTEQLGKLRSDGSDTLYLTKRLCRTMLERWKRLSYHQMCAETGGRVNIERIQHSPIPGTTHLQDQETEASEGIPDTQTRTSLSRSPIGWTDRVHRPPSVGHSPLATEIIDQSSKIIDLKGGSHFPSIPPVIGPDEDSSSGSTICLYDCPYCDEFISSKGPLNNGPWATHVWRDIRPLVCLFKDCEADKTYSSTTAWLAHMRARHGKPVWICSLCAGEIEKLDANNGGAIHECEKDFVTHLRTDHKATLNQDELVVVANHSRLDMLFDACLICGSEQGLQAPKNTVYRTYSAERQSNLISCMRTHLENLGLISLPNESHLNKGSENIITEASPATLPSRTQQEQRLRYSGSRSNMQGSADPVFFPPVLPKTAKHHNSETDSKSPWARKVILSLDGTGMHAIRSLLILRKLLRCIQDLELHSSPPHSSSSAYDWGDQNSLYEDMLGDSRDQDSLYEDMLGDSQFFLHHYVDHFVGAGTGGLSALALGRLHMEVSDVLKLFDRIGDNVIAKPRSASIRGILRPRFDENYMRTTLRESFAKHIDTVHGRSELRQPNADSSKVTVLLWEVDAVVACPKWASTYDTKPLQVPSLPFERRLYETLQLFNHPLWQIAEATCASPQNFPRCRIGEAHYMDGSIAHANPLAEALLEMSREPQGGTPALVISMGTGIGMGESHLPTPRKRAKSSTQFVFSNLRALVPTLPDLSHRSEQAHKESEEILQALHGHRDEAPKYFRFNPPVHTLGGPWEWDKGDQRRKIKQLPVALIEEVEEYMARLDVRSAIAECARHLVAIRRRRQATLRWESFADSGIFYQCPSCKNFASFEDRSKLELHGIEKHEFISKIEMVHHGKESEGSIGGVRRYEWTCNRSHDGTDSMFCFDLKDDFLRHLKESHDLRNPRIISPLELHAWLDSGRSQK